MRMTKKNHASEIMSCVNRICLLILMSLFGAVSCRGETVSSIVGYQQFEIKKGWLWLEMPFKGLDGNYFTLQAILKSNAACEGDEVYYYTLTPTNINILLAAKVERTDDGLHFFQVNSKCAGDGTVSRVVNHEMNVDNFTLLPTISSNNAKVRIRYFRKTDETTEFTISGEVSPLLLTDESDEKTISDMSSLAVWIKNRICYQAYKDNMDTLVSMMTKDESLKSGRSFVDELLEFARMKGPVYFYAHFKGKEDTPTRVLFNPINSKFINASKDGAPTKIEIDTSIIREFGTVDDEFASNKIESARRLPVDIIEEMNRLLHAGFFDYKELFWLVKKNGSTILVMYDKNAHSVIDCRKGAVCNLEREDIVGFSDVPVPNDRSAGRPPIIGKGRYLTRDEVEYLERIILPYHINLTFWSIIVWIIGQVLQVISNKVIAHIIPEEIPSMRKVLLWIFYLVLPIGLFVSIIKKLISKKRGGDPDVDVPPATGTSNSESKNVEAKVETPVSEQGQTIPTA